MVISYFNRLENIVGKRENAGYQHFLLFPQCFQNASISGSLKVRTVWYRVNIQEPVFHSIPAESDITLLLIKTFILKVRCPEHRQAKVLIEVLHRSVFTVTIAIHQPWDEV